MKKIIYALALAGSLFGASCSGFLDRTPFDSIAKEDAYKNLKDAEAALNGIYSAWNDGGLYSGHLTLLPDVQCDFVYPIVGFSNSMGSVYSWNIISTNDYTQTVYATLYKVISNVNLLIDSKDQMTITDGQRARFNDLLGQAYFSRALAYTELLKLYAAPYDPATAETQLGVSIWNTFGVGKPERSTIAKSYSQILEDLKSADALLAATGKEETADERSMRINRGTLAALYTRVYFYMNNWEKAIESATSLIDNPEYALATGITQTDTVATATEFHNMWEFDRSNEIIWKLTYTKTNRPGSLGSSFCAMNGDALRIDYTPSHEMINLFDANDIRRSTYFSDEIVNGSVMPIIVKYPGNPELRPTEKPVYSNMPKVFRLAEIYLIRAEAHARNRAEGLANQDLKTLREHRIKGYQHTTVNGNVLMQEIRKERICELYMEGHRLYDLKRYGEGFTRKPQIQSIAPGDAMKITPTNHRFVWPIPSHEMDANLSMVQNPGY